MDTFFYSLHRNTRDQDYSTWVSKILGSLIKDPVACQILEEKLKSSSSLSSSGQNKNKTGIGTKRWWYKYRFTIHVLVYTDKNNHFHNRDLIFYV